METLSTKLMARVELPISIAVTLAAIGSRRLEYVVERYSNCAFLARVRSDCAPGMNGTAFAASPMLALTKAHAELIERSTVAMAAGTTPTTEAVGAAASIFRQLAEQRAHAEIIERDALVNFWAACSFLEDVTDRHDWARFVKSTGLTKSLRVLQIPSHTMKVAVALLGRTDRHQDGAICAIGCHAGATIVAAGMAAVREAIMLALNAPDRAILMPRLKRLDDDAPIRRALSTHHFSLEMSEFSRGSHTIKLIRSGNLSGLTRGRSMVCARSYEGLYHGEPPNMSPRIPLFTRDAGAS